MSERDEQARLDRLVDQAVDEFLLVPDNQVLDRVKELTGAKESAALDFDRLMVPILNESKHQNNPDLRIQSEAALTSTWRRLLAWSQTNDLRGTFSSRPIRSALASLVFVVVGATLSFPIWRTALGPDAISVDSGQSHPSRNVPKDAPGPAGPSTGGGSVYMAQLVKSLSYAKAAEALDRINAKYPSLFRDQSRVIRRANNGDDSTGYIGGLGGLGSARDAEQICSKVRAGGDLCNVVNVPNE
jgi:hypothetical protein